jgi:hypothetical protein
MTQLPSALLKMDLIALCGSLAALPRRATYSGCDQQFPGLQPPRDLGTPQSMAKPDSP